MKREYAEEIAADLKRDYESRAEARRPFETQWRLNLNFYMGNQYCTANVNGDITDVERDYYWQEREAFNHISALVETRQAKLNTVRPSLTVRPFSSDDSDIKTAKTSSKILSSTCDKLDMDAILTDGTMWSEITGTAFYFVGWDETAGLKIGDGACEGDVFVRVLSPFEVYPDNVFAQNVGDCRSILTARAVDVAEIKRVYGKTVAPEPSEVLRLSSVAIGGGLTTETAVGKITASASTKSATVIERYTLPTDGKPDGEYAVAANGVLLHYGPLPYVNGADGKRVLPFVKQVAIVNAGCFFGTSIVERAIPVQRAYNAVKNRKHEFMNRLSMGVMAVEDGSVDIDNLEQEGISPGKILVYRQGATPPRMIDCGSVPHDFDQEEARLLNEFTRISGVSEIMRSSQSASGATSGVALQLLIEQDDTRLSLSAEYVRLAAREIARQILRLYKQFGSDMRLSRIAGKEGKIELIKWSASDISSDDVVFTTDNELLSTPAMRQNMMFELYKMGLLSDADGNMTESAKHRFMNALGYGGWDSDISLSDVHVRRAEAEDEKGEFVLNEFDDHALHIDTHVKYLLTENPTGKKAERLKAHIREHKAQSDAAQEQSAPMPEPVSNI
ncbi:MAG: hypothetical protein J1G38_03235 [Clostridiales bacterium]|nr:hypothetical protein [Clostridiales bacterium]